MLAVSGDQDVINLLGSPPANQSEKDSGNSFDFCILVAVLIYFVVNAVFCGYVTCRRCKNIKNGGKYGKILKDLDSEVSDTTDSEWDSSDFGLSSIDPVAKQ